MSAADIRRHLQSSVGILPCDEWLEACLLFLQETHPTTTLSADQVLYQLLHSDLRDVIRPTEEENNAPQIVLPNSPAQQMDQARANSLSSERKQQSLTFSQPLLCQVEELLDVSKNAEARLALGPAQPDAPTPIGNQHNRCLKLCLSHGHFEASINPNNPIIAMEILPIPNLSSNTLAGCKLLIHGQATIRWGVVMLHPGNTTVLGGSVPALVDIQQQALAQAQRQAGVGVDATVRALIGTNTTVPDDEAENDEAEEASGDVALTLAVAAAAAVPPRAAPVYAAGGGGDAGAGTNNTKGPPPPVRQPFSERTSIQQPSRLTPTAVNSIASSISPHPTTPAPQVFPQAIPTPTGTVRNSSPSNPYHRNINDRNTHTTNHNPYNNATSTSKIVTNSSLPASIGNQLQQAIPTPPSNSVFSSTASFSSTTPAVTTHQPTITPRLEPNPSTASHTVSSTIKETAVSTPHNTMMEESNVQNMAFENLYRLLQQIVQNRNMYESYQRITFQARLQRVGNQMHYNIEKNPNYTKGKRPKNEAKPEKYEMAIHVTFGDPTENSKCRVACKLAPNAVAPYYEKSAAEMRQISRADRGEGQRLAAAGGKRVSDAFFERPLNWNASLYPEPDTVFMANSPYTTLDDVLHPVLLLVPQD